MLYKQGRAKTNHIGGAIISPDAVPPWVGGPVPLQLIGRLVPAAHR
jgi:hypothetical protein